MSDTNVEQGETAAHPFTHDTGDSFARRRKWCKCVECGRVALCTPHDDFYILAKGDPLRCESPCYWKWFHATGGVKRVAS